ncbi:hypothetical protein BPLS_P6645 [Bathymodiolus platifrons methanotrophic gill symbiont]|uniref:hypothetical protein n=1 Tax=Bathymodiolus platifrons methanotrophic gill symbiont TaxID=113268 RepID=UPI000B41F13A|nr:hypothetical protein [Bathymodiolus platifrons methanotrophic gill symbiont]GFO77909.1 hypothetical protein BPLS_P6645 [Bathymodiolus platifrons methanotrophic gill symbiont]
MITDIEISSTVDVSKENETYNVRKNNLPENTKVAAAAWSSASGSLYDDRLLVLRFIFSLVMTKMPGFTLWYFEGDGGWQDDTRILRWKRRKQRGINITHYSELYEEMLERDNKVKFFRAISLSELSIESVVKSLNEDSHSYIISLPGSTNIKGALCMGWEHLGLFDKELLRYVINNKGIIFKVYGEFDDPEYGFVGLGDPELVKSLVQ